MKNQMPFLLLCAAAALSMLASCKKDNGNDDCGGPNPNFPFMETGHSITFAYDELFGSSGDVTYTYGDQNADGSFNVSVSGTPKPAALAGIDNFFYKACGDKFYTGIETIAGGDNWQYKANAKAGESWTHKFDGGQATYTVLEDGLTVSTIAGDIPNCAKITYQQALTFNTDTVYWSDQIGWVKYDGFLLSYELKSKNF